jgi:arginase family enzyme
MTPRVLDFDGGTLPLPGEDRIDLANWQEAIRFACTSSALAALEGHLGDLLDDGRPLFMGSGDFHHITYLRLRRLAGRQHGLRVVVLDNHPDNMRYPFGIHCGSWVAPASRLPRVTRIDVLGICSPDVVGWRALENRLSPLRAGRLHYWCIDRPLGTLRRLGARDVQSFGSPTELLAAFATTLDDSALYLSIDKDVLAPDVVRTNWDQGRFAATDLAAAIELMAPHLIGSDVVGEVSAYRYRSRFKRLLSGLDGQSLPPPDPLLRWQHGQQEINCRILTWLGGSRPR